MKDSGVEWIGEIPLCWNISKIGNLYVMRNTKVSDFDYPPLSVTNKGILHQLDTAAKSNAHDDRKLVRVGDFAINSRSDRRGSCGISPYNGSVSLINIIIRPITKMYLQYYDWLFHTVQFSDEFYRWGHGIVDDLWTTGWQDMKKITIPIPPIDEQQKIADFLDEKCSEIDSLIADIEKQIETLEEYKRSVITEAVTKGLNPDVEMKDSGVQWIGEIPKNWTVKPIKYCFKIISGSTPKSENYEYWDGKIIWVTPADYKTKDKYISKGKRNLSNLGYSSCSTILVPKGSIIFSKRAPIGTVAINVVDLCTNQGCLSCIPFSGVYSEYFYYVIRICTEEFELYGSGTTFKEISSTSFGNIKLPFPTFIVQKHISVYLNRKCIEIDNVISEKKQQITTIEEYKKSLIFEYVTGKKEVKK